MGRSGSSSSSGEEDGDAEWRAAIDSVTAAATFSKRDSNGFPSSSSGRAILEDEEENPKPQSIKHYQIKALKLLDDLLDKTIEVVTNTTPVLEKDPAENDAGVRLFKDASPGIVFDHIVELHGPKKKPKLVPGEELDEKSKKFRKKLQSAAVEGADIIAAARAASQKSLAKLEAREAAAKVAAKREEERVAELKKIRGERWLPSVARQMGISTQRHKQNT
ncbi:uncharacterized protein LOC105177819 isoform X2 [Sesamum indicum]|uniref:Uncharacterized protein LOC105177819 isoform X1 n=1 Tax=Sesamum indicum TaxID=4182 RepID=A0A6I9UK17_SESIN|nr:uncharacterized protein LOC105177819 isoform X1 [Sesamum indicum]XP_011099376.1 uncharacterized protein LOC105177819 isoform X2 [Sesamum indicum]